MADFYQSGKIFDEELYKNKLLCGILCLVVILFFSGCVCAYSSYPEKSFRIAVDQNYVASIIAGSVISYDTTNNLVYYEVLFDEVNGGTNYLFGIWKVKEVSGNKVERLKFKSGEETLAYSIKDSENASSSEGIIYVPFIPK